MNRRGARRSQHDEISHAPADRLRHSIPIKTIPLSRLETSLSKALTDCADSGETLVVEMPDNRLLAIQPLDGDEDDPLVDELLESNAEFRTLIARSKRSGRKPFVVGERFGR